MKVIYTSKQLKLIKEQIETDRHKIKNDFIVGNHYSWFNRPIQISEDRYKDGMNYTIDYLTKQYDTKRVIVSDNDKLVGFLIFAETTISKEVPREMNNTPMNVILSTAIDPEYRNRKLFNKMLTESQITKPFIVHLGDHSPFDFWEKFGCKPIYEYPSPNKGNFVFLCR